MWPLPTRVELRQSCWRQRPTQGGCSRRGIQALVGNADSVWCQHCLPPTIRVPSGSTFMFPWNAATESRGLFIGLWQRVRAQGDPETRWWISRAADLPRSLKGYVLLEGLDGKPCYPRV